MSATTTMFAARVFKLYAQEFSIKGLAIKSAYSGPGLMSFHFDKAETTAFAGEDIGGYLYGSYSSKFREEFTHIFF